jgi:hypothetical protein
MIIRCPCCNGTGLINEYPPVRLSEMQYRIWDIVRRAPHGIAVGELVNRVYADHPNGGPISAPQSVCVTVWKANKRLALANQKIVSTKGRGSIYSLQHIDEK